MNIIYSSKYQLKEIISKISPDKIFKKVHDEINKYVINRLPYPDITQENYDPQIIVEHLFNIRQLIEDRSKQISNIFSYYEWIYHIRRLPDIFFSGRLETTYPYDISLALYLASFSTNKNFNFKRINYQKIDINLNNSIQIPLTKKKINYIFRFIYHVRFLSHIDVLIRRSSKGVMLIKKSNYDCLPIEVPNQYLQESITIFDKRMELFSGHIAGIYSKTGLSTDKFIYFDEKEIVIPAVCRIKDSHPLALPVTFSNEERINISPGYFIYFQEYKIIQDYLRTINSSHVFDLYMISIIAIFLYLSLDFIFTKNLPLVGFYQVGYFLFDKSSFEKFAEDHFNEAKKTVEKIFLQEVDFDVHTVFREMIKKSASSYPFYSPGYFYIGWEDQICVDLDTCSSMLTRYLEHKVIEGDLANKRATQFENSLQKLIDSTTFKPDKNVRDIVDKKSINFKSEQITDIDAAFHYKGTLILVSAKSYIYNMEYDKGNYNYIRNIKSNIEADICKWRNKIDFINNNPIGDNYDLSSYGKIQGILCTPSLFYIGADYYKSKIECGIDEYQSATELYDLITNS